MARLFIVTGQLKAFNDLNFNNGVNGRYSAVYRSFAINCISPSEIAQNTVFQIVCNGADSLPKLQNLKKKINKLQKKFHHINSGGGLLKTTF